ncbi:hypothetical protein GH714_021425 [Hevea brasiliensis]|uniref:Aspartic peptidase DDI1-type domain-containing protein n=1 Tax=Hevea brasiliensis TaxID=3981 RepID=A0A6A6LE83_HEVBR|nr:hypothetical protein GH714_021425 [Hevea brasiliensis]
MKVGGQEVLALMDTGASNNFLREEEAKRLGIPYEREMGWLKAVNSTPNLVHGVARNVKVRIGDWKGTLDFFVVSMDEYQCVLGVDFVDRVKAIPMLFANSICITEGGGIYGSCVAGEALTVEDPCNHAHGGAEANHQLLSSRGRSSMEREEVLPRVDQRSVRGNTPKLLKGHPPRRKVDCAREFSGQKSRDVASPRQGVRGKSLMEEQTEAHRVSWGAIWQVQAEMRFKLPSRAQNEVHCGLEAYWRLRSVLGSYAGQNEVQEASAGPKANRACGSELGRDRPKTRFTRRGAGPSPEERAGTGAGSAGRARERRAGK